MLVRRHGKGRRGQRQADDPLGRQIGEQRGDQPAHRPAVHHDPVQIERPRERPEEARVRLGPRPAPGRRWCMAGDSARQVGSEHRTEGGERWDQIEPVRAATGHRVDQQVRWRIRRSGCGVGRKVVHRHPTDIDGLAADSGPPRRPESPVRVTHATPPPRGIRRDGTSATASGEGVDGGRLRGGEWEREDRDRRDACGLTEASVAVDHDDDATEGLGAAVVPEEEVDRASCFTPGRSALGNSWCRRAMTTTRPSLCCAASSSYDSRGSATGHRSLSCRGVQAAGSWLTMKGGEPSRSPVPYVPPEYEVADAQGTAVDRRHLCRGRAGGPRS